MRSTSNMIQVAVRLGEESKEKEAYCQYLRTIQYIANALLEEDEPQQEVEQMLRLAEQCLERAKAFVQKSADPLDLSAAASCSHQTTDLPATTLRQATVKSGLQLGAQSNPPPEPTGPSETSLKTNKRKRASPASNRSSKKRAEVQDGWVNPVLVKPVPSQIKRPLLVYVNPKSGGNKVVDLTKAGPREGMERFRHVPNLMILACGGDGTVGWILSTLDHLGLRPQPPVAILPLGTGNDLARSLNWGAPTIDVFNDYFSLGFDADVTLGFHQAREANPENFKNRIRNMWFYLKTAFSHLTTSTDLAKNISVVCDGEDLTARIQELSSILFLNIQNYCAGTTPWGQPSGFEPQSVDDGLIEVIGFTKTSLAWVQVGGHGGGLHQGREVILTTYKPIAMQVDGEPCMLSPSIIRITRRNQASMVQKSNRRSSMPKLNE